MSVDDICRADEQGLQELFESLHLPYAQDSSFWVVESPNKISYAGHMGEDMLHLRVDGHDLYLLRKFDENSGSYVNSVTFDRTVYRNVDGGVNILVYDTVTQMVVDCFGISAEDRKGDVIR